MRCEKTEGDIQRECMIELSKLGAIVWRNNTGVHRAEGRYIRYGLCVGSSDIIGIYNGRFLAVEVKKPNKKPTKRQLTFIDTVNAHGGIAFYVTKKEDIRKKILEN